MKNISFVTSYHTGDPRTGFTVWVLELYADGKSVTAYPFEDMATAVHAVLTRGALGNMQENTCGLFEQIADEEFSWDTDMDRTDEGFTYITWITTDN